LRFALGKACWAREKRQAAETVAPKFLASPGSVVNHFARRAQNMPFVDEKQFKYPAEDECLVRRLGSAVIAAWPQLTPDVRERILTEAKVAWDREHFVSKLPNKLEGIIRRRHS
jgi:hypothetical protein